MAAKLHLAKMPSALHLLLQHLEGLIDIVVTARTRTCMRRSSSIQQTFLKSGAPAVPTPGLSYIQTYFDWFSRLAQAAATFWSGSEPGNVAHPAFSMSSSRFHELVFFSIAKDLHRHRQRAEIYQRRWVPKPGRYLPVRHP